MQNEVCHLVWSQERFKPLRIDLGQVANHRPHDVIVFLLPEPLIQRAQCLEPIQYRHVYVQQNQSNRLAHPRILIVPIHELCSAVNKLDHLLAVTEELGPVFESKLFYHKLDGLNIHKLVVCNYNVSFVKIVVNTFLAQVIDKPEEALAIF